MTVAPQAPPTRVRAPLLAVLLLLPLAAAGAPANAPTGDLIVTLRDGSAAPDDITLLSVVPAFVVHDATRADLARYASDPRVERIDRAVPLEPHGAPALPSNAHHGLTRASAPSALTGAGVTVAIIDSGIDAAHPDLAGRVKAGVRLVSGRFVDASGDTDGHGTHVAGIVAGNGAASNGRWEGVAPGVDLIGVDISDRFTTSSAVLAYDWLYVNRERLGIDIVVNAWGHMPVGGESFDPHDPEIRAIDRLIAAGVVVIFSASNHGPGPGTLSVEAMDPHVITVGATDAAALLASYSSRGPIAADGAWTKPDVVAPGDAVVGPRSLETATRSDDPDPLYTVYSGTSQAAPHVAGIVARMLEADPALSPSEILEALRASAIDLDAPGPDDATGYGLVDAEDAVRIARSLAPDRANVLIAGGIDKHEDAAELDATPRRSLLDLATRPDVVWETRFAVKPGAQRVRVDVDAEGARSLGVELVKGARIVRGGDIERPEPGVWTLRVRGDLPLATRAQAHIASELPPHPERALAYDAHSPRPPAPALPTLTEQDSLGGIDPWVWLPLGMWAASGAVLAYAVMPQRKAEASTRRPPETHAAHPPRP